MSTRAIAFVAVGIIVLGIAGFFAYSKITELESQVAGLDRQLTDTEQRLSQAEARAGDAARAATAAETRAAEATDHAAEAQGRADDATVKATASEQQALEATEDREAAEQARSDALAAQSAAEAEKDAAARQAQEAREAEAAALEQARIAREEADALRRQREIELNRLQEALNTIVETRRTAIGVVMNLGERVEFEFDKAELRPSERELLARIAGVLIATADQGYAIQVFGHTDDVGSTEYNQGLSERRAEAVRIYLVEAGVSPDIISMKGMGKTMPLVEGTDQEARDRNRRVEIAIIDTKIDFR